MWPSWCPPFAPDTAAHGSSAALEFGVRVLEIPHLMVLGHGQCGGVKALLAGESGAATDFMPHRMSIATAARVAALRCESVQARQQICAHECIRISLANLMSFPWIADRVAQGRLTLHGAWYSIRTGTLTVLDAQGAFAPPA